MKILLYSDYWKLKSGYGREMSLLLPEFIKAGHEIAYLALDYNGVPLNDDTNVRVYPGKIEGETSYFAKHMLMHALEDFKPDVVFTRQDYFALPEIAFTLAKPLGHKWVHWGLADGEPLGKNLDEPIRWVNQHVFTTQFTRRVVQAENSSIKGEVVYPPINTQLWDKKLSKDELRAKFGITNKEVLVCVARNQVRKNIPCLLESVKILKEHGHPDILLILVSHETKSLSGNNAGYDIDHLVRYYGLEENVLRPGTLDGKILDDDAIAEIYAMSDIFALPTMGEGFGLIFSEATAAGLPVVTTHYAGGVESAFGGFVQPSQYLWDTDNVKQAIVDPSDFALGIERVLNMSEEEKNSIVMEGKRFISDLSPEIVAKKLLKIMEDTVENDVKPLALL